MTAFGQRFKKLLQLRGLTQEQAAKLLETTQSVVSYYCSLERPPRRRTLGIMSDRLGVSVEELMGVAMVDRPDIKRGRKVSGPRRQPPTPSHIDAMDKLKARWKKRSNERDSLRHLIAVLYGDDADKILTWLDEP